MPRTFESVIQNNHTWVEQKTKDDPEYFSRLAVHHHPQFLFIGCSDARVPANVITQTAAGEMFVHRNVANMVVPTDTNLLAVLQYAVVVLGVSDIIVCGHYGCGGVKAAMSDPGSAPPFVENWLSNIRTVARMRADELALCENDDERYRRLVELNVTEQVFNLSQTLVVRTAWSDGMTLRIHGVVYTLAEGILHDLGVMADGTSVERSGQCPAVAASRAVAVAG